MLEPSSAISTFYVVAATLTIIVNVAFWTSSIVYCDLVIFEVNFACIWWNTKFIPNTTSTSVGSVDTGLTPVLLASLQRMHFIERGGEVANRAGCFSMIIKLRELGVG